MNRVIRRLMVLWMVGSAASICAADTSGTDLERAASEAQAVPAFKMFDNLYYVGLDWVSAYLIATDDGLILIDTLYGEFTSQLVDSIRKLGFDPAQIKYVLCTHAHYDHVGGAAVLQALTRARIGMTAADWDLLDAERKAGRLRHVASPRDLVLKEGDILTLGDTRVKFYVTPGHTPGVLSMEFTVKEGEQRFRAFMFGGMGLNFSGVKAAEQYVASVRRIRSLGKIDVNVTNHPSAGRIFERAQRLSARKNGEPNPFVAPNDFQSWLNQLEADGQKKLNAEKKRAEKK